MSTKNLVWALVGVLSWELGACTAVAQTTMFQYQGRLNNSGQPANGTYDFSFSLFPTNSDGSPAAPTLTNSAVAVSQGCFVTTLDFGALFDGTSFWLEIGVRSNGSSGAFVTLSPRQPLRPVPYAMFAPTAGTVSGVISTSNLPASVVLQDGNVNFSGTVTASSFVAINPVIMGTTSYAPDIGSITEVFSAYPYFTNLTWKFMDFAGSNSFTVLRAACTNTYGPWCIAVPPTGPATSMPIWFQFGLDSDSVILALSGNGEYWGLAIDGADDDTRRQVPIDGLGHFYKVSFANSRRRQVVLKMSNGGGFLGCWIDPTNGWLGGGVSPARRMLVLGDSFTEDPTSQSFPSRLMQLFHNLDVWASGVGGTGYVSSGMPGGSRTNFQGRVMVDVIANSPDYVLVAGGINDVATSSNQVFAAAAELLTTIKTNLPAAQIIVVGPWWPRRADPVGDANVFATMHAISNACATVGVTRFIDNLSDPWITGVYNQPGSGNAVNYTSNDGTHPTPAGHWYLAYRLADVIGSALPELIPSNIVH
jgi:lysophospholipase L1-like esterase